MVMLTMTACVSKPRREFHLVGLIPSEARYSQGRICGILLKHLGAWNVFITPQGYSVSFLHHQMMVSTLNLD